MPKTALALIVAATATILALAATVLGDINIVLPSFRLRPHLLAGPVVAAGIGLTAGLALLERVPRRSTRVA